MHTDGDFEREAELAWNEATDDGVLTKEEEAIYTLAVKISCVMTAKLYVDSENPLINDIIDEYLNGVDFVEIARGYIETLDKD